MRPLTSLLPILPLLSLPVSSFVLPSQFSFSVFRSDPTLDQNFYEPLPSSTPESDDSSPLPLVIWHGLGDSFENDGLKSVGELAEKVNPGTYVYIVQIGETGAADRQASFLGNLTDQINLICSSLAADPILSTAPAINALGFSQGGQFLRGYIERCNKPPVRNLVTFGSQHNGISKFQGCASGDWVCLGAEALLRGGTWTALAQSHLVPAQYFRNPEELEPYLEHSNFLADINNERSVKNSLYKKNLASLNKFAMYVFEKDTTAIPKESGWFAEVNVTSNKVTDLRDRAIYKEDWIGLKKLDEKGALDFNLVKDAEHMHLSQETLEAAFTEYFAPVKVKGKDIEDLQNEL